MNRIDLKFRELKRSSKKAFIAYITAGDPDLDTTEKLVIELEKSGADIIELGIPFSDPIADGPVIQAASCRALDKNANLAKIFRMVRLLRCKTEIPIVFMTYCNPVFRYGVKRFFADCNRMGVDGLIVPDMPYEESGDLLKKAKKYDVDMIFLASPTSTRKRLKDIVRKTRGFVYYVSLTGVTGARKKLPPKAMDKVRQIKSLSDKPVCLGFGVSSPSQAADVAAYADGVIIGSAIVKIIADKKDVLKRVSGFAKKMANAIHRD